MYKKHFNSFSGKISPDRKNFNTSYPASICSGNYYTGGGISTTKRVVESLQAPRHAELVSASPDLTRGFRNKFGMTENLIAIVLLFFLLSFSANVMAQTKIVTFTAASPPTLTATDIRNALQSVFPTSASFEEFIAVIHPDVTTIGGRVMALLLHIILPLRALLM